MVLVYWTAPQHEIELTTSICSIHAQYDLFHEGRSAYLNGIVMQLSNYKEERTKESLKSAIKVQLEAFHGECIASDNSKLYDAQCFEKV